MNLVVVDTSIIVKWFLAEDREPLITEAKELLKAHLEGKQPIVIPTLACYELGNVLTTQSYLLPADKTAYLHDFYTLSLHILPLDEPMAIDTMKMASRYDITFYDAAFLTLADQLGCPFLTADTRLVKKARSLPFVLPLEERGH
jgi:predicted nucleic acid-binding protein